MTATAAFCVLHLNEEDTREDTNKRADEIFCIGRKNGENKRIGHCGVSKSSIESANRFSVN